MSRNLVPVNLARLDGRVFVGRPAGIKARKYFRLEDFNELNDKIEFIVPDNTISVNSSFFLGLFGEDVHRIANFDDFFDYVDIGKLDQRLRAQLETAVRRSLSKSSYGI